eukprot:NODE_7_length_67686_cov_1.621421.p44 type:complete len:180 gc:universal NODE_7_length_67686_cov_1.621421:59935-59396(-)
MNLKYLGHFKMLQTYITILLSGMALLFLDMRMLQQPFLRDPPKLSAKKCRKIPLTLERKNYTKKDVLKSYSPWNNAEYSNSFNSKKMQQQGMVYSKYLGNVIYFLGLLFFVSIFDYLNEKKEILIFKQHFDVVSNKNCLYDTLQKVVEAEEKPQFSSYYRERKKRLFLSKTDSGVYLSK